MKTCSHCNTVKPLTEFHAHPTKSGGRDHRCKACAKQARAALRQRHLQVFRVRELKRWHARQQRAAA